MWSLSEILHRRVCLLQASRELKIYRNSTMHLMISTEKSSMIAATASTQTALVISGYLKRRQRGCMSEECLWCKSTMVPCSYIHFSKPSMASQIFQFGIRRVVSCVLTVEGAVFTKTDHSLAVFTRWVLRRKRTVQ